jgi:hypothetical protein
MLYPPGLREILLELFLRYAYHIAVLIENDAARACCSGVQSHNVLLQDNSSQLFLNLLFADF